MMTLFKAWSFIKRDFQIEISYRLSFLLRMINSIIPLFALFYISRLIPADQSEHLVKYGGNYFCFVMIGLAFARFSQIALTMFSESIRTSQMTGCLEAMLSSQTSPAAIVLYSSLYSLISAAVEVTILFLIALFFFGLTFPHANLPVSLLIIVLSTIAFVSFGILSAASIVWMKKGDPVTWMFTHFSAILGGALFPVDVLPFWMQVISYLIPIKYTLEALRLTLIQGYSLIQVQRPVLILAGMAILLFPLSIRLFRQSVHHAKCDGTLMQY